MTGRIPPAPAGLSPRISRPSACAGMKPVSPPPNRLDWPGNYMPVNYNKGAAKRAGLAMAVLENRVSRFVAPAAANGTAALAGNATAMPENLRLSIPNPSGPEVWPTIAYSRLLLHKNCADGRQGERVKKLLIGYCETAKNTRMSGYTPLPEGQGLY